MRKAYESALMNASQIAETYGIMTHNGGRPHDNLVVTIMRSYCKDRDLCCQKELRTDKKPDFWYPINLIEDAMRFFYKRNCYQISGNATIGTRLHSYFLVDTLYHVWNDWNVSQTEEETVIEVRDNLTSKSAVLTEKELAVELGNISPWTVRNMRIRAGMPYIKVGSRIFYRLQTVLDWMAKQEEMNSATAPEEQQYGVMRKIY